MLKKIGIKRNSKISNNNNNINLKTKISNKDSRTAANSKQIKTIKIISNNSISNNNNNSNNNREDNTEDLWCSILHSFLKKNICLMTTWCLTSKAAFLATDNNLINISSNNKTNNSNKINNSNTNTNFSITFLETLEQIKYFKTYLEWVEEQINKDHLKTFYKK